MTLRLARSSGSCVLLALSLTASPLALAKDKPEIRYALTRTDVAVSVAMTLVSCPSEVGELPEIETSWAIAPIGSADPEWPVQVDVSSGFLAKRSNAFEFNPNGTLSAFNGRSEGQGGAFIGNVLKTVGALAPLVFGLPPVGMAGHGIKAAAARPNDSLYCRAETNATLNSLAKTKAEIRALEDRVLTHAATSDDLDMLERRRKKRIALVEALTFEKAAKFDAPQGRAANWIGKVELPELLKDWFSREPGDASPGAVPFSATKISGLGGFGVTINPTDNRLIEGPPVGLTKAPREAQRSLLYRRPVLAKVVATDLACKPPRECSKPLELDGPLLIGQWGEVSSLPVGNAGLFGSREASASFDAFGTPVKLSYGSDSGSADIGETFEAAGGAVTAIADADTAALERAIKREELRQKLRDLRAADAGTTP
jgi:hypothetical protein